MKTWMYLLLICLVSLGFRLWQLQTIPMILNRDEAALAFNAKLLKETGKDEWGRSWPLALESFGDYKLPGYVWSLIPAFSVFGYHDWVVRLPSVLAGVLLIPVSFLLAKAIGWKEKKTLLVALVTATSPVFFFYSRIAFEANVALLLLVGALTLLYAKKTAHHVLFDVLAVFFYALAVFTYNTPLLLLPFIVLTIPVMRGIKSWQKWVVPVGGLLFVTVIGGMQLLSLSKQKSGITIFQDESIWRKSVQNYERYQGIQRVLFANKFSFYGSLIAQNYLKSFTHSFLVQGKGGHPWHSATDSGHVQAIVYVLSLVGFIYCVIKPTRQNLVLVYLLFISLLPSVVTVDAPHATRSLLFFFMLHLLAAHGAGELLRTRLKKQVKYAQIIFVVLLIGSFLLYTKNYFTKLSNLKNAVSLKPQFNTLIKDIDKKFPNQPIAIVDDEGFHYVLLAWYLELTPAEFFSTVVRQQPDKIGFRYGEQVDRYHFIAAKNDRQEFEKVMVHWNTYDKIWQVEEH